MPLATSPMRNQATCGVPAGWDSWRDSKDREGAEFRRQIASVMKANGWTSSPEGLSLLPGAEYGAFQREARPDFIVRVTFRWSESARDEEGVGLAGATAEVGVTYTPLDRLRWVLTGELSRDGVFDDIVDLASLPEGTYFALQTAADRDRSVSRLMELVDAHALPFALEHASVEGFLEAWQSTESDRLCEDSERVPALLGAAGRFDEARSALEHYLDIGGEVVSTRRYRRFARQLLRFLDAGGEVAEPSELPRPRFDLGPRPEPLGWQTIWTTWWDHRERDLAAASVRRRTSGHSRSELRSMLYEEVDRRGLVVRPSWIEAQLDMFQRPDLEAEWKSWSSGAKVLFKLGRHLVDVWHGEGPTRPPTWLEPPDRAGYPMRSSRERVTGVLPWEAARPWLDHVVESMPRHFRPEVGSLRGLLNVDVWLTWDSGSERPEPVLAVFLGDHRVGEIARKDEGAFLPVMEHAAERDEVPWTSAQLTFGYLNESGYLLEVPMPAADDEPTWPHLPR